MEATSSLNPVWSKAFPRSGTFLSDFIEVNNKLLMSLGHLNFAFLFVTSANLSLINVKIGTLGNDASPTVVKILVCALT